MNPDLLPQYVLGIRIYWFKSIFKDHVGFFSYPQYRNNIEWEFKQYMRETQEKQYTQSHTVIIQIESTSNKPKDNNQYESNLRHFMPTNNFRLAKPI